MNFSDNINLFDDEINEINEYLNELKKIRNKKINNNVTNILSLGNTEEEEKLISSIREVKKNISFRIKLIELLCEFSELYIKSKNKISNQEKKNLAKLLFNITSSISGQGNFNDFVSDVYQSRQELNNLKDLIPEESSINGSDLLFSSCLNLLNNFINSNLKRKNSYNNQKLITHHTTPIITEYND